MPVLDSNEPPTDLTVPSASFAPQNVFQVVPLNWDEWKAVLYISAPVILIDEVLKFISVSGPRTLSTPLGAPDWSGGTISL